MSAHHQQGPQVGDRQHEHAEHAVGAVDQRQAFLLGQHDRLDPGVAQRLGGVAQRARRVAHRPLPHQRQRAVRERREVARAAERAVLVHDRRDAGRRASRRTALATTGRTPVRPVASVESRSSISARTTSRSTSSPEPAACERISPRCSSSRFSTRDVQRGQRAEAGRDAVVRRPTSAASDSTTRAVRAISASASGDSSTAAPSRATATTSSSDGAPTPTMTGDLNMARIRPSGRRRRTATRRGTVSYLRQNAPAAAHALQLLKLLARHAAPAAGVGDRARPRASRAARPTTCSTCCRTRASSSTCPRSAATGSASAPTSSAAPTCARTRCAGSPRPSLTRLVAATTHNAHLAVLQGREVLYVIEERAPGRPGLVTDVGVRLPAHLTASGLAMLAALPPQQVDALFPSRRVLTRRHDAGPASLTQLRALLGAARGAGFAEEDGFVTPGLRLGRLRRCSTTRATRSRRSRVTYPAAEGEPDGAGRPRRAAPPRASRAAFVVAVLDNTFRYGNMIEQMARAATTADAFNAVAEPRRREILDLLAGGRAPRQRPRAAARPGPAAGVQAPAGPPRSGSGRRA